MRDAFAEFGLERRPWVEPEVVLARYHELAAIRHPDKCGGDSSPLVRLNEARGILSSPSSRLRHLLNFLPGTETGKFQPDFEMFSKVGLLVRQAEQISAKKEATTEALEKAILEMLALIAQRLEALEENIRQLDSRWPGVSPGELAVLAEEISFLEKWKKSLREARTLLLGG